MAMDRDAVTCRHWGHTADDPPGVVHGPLQPGSDFARFTLRKEGRLFPVDLLIYNLILPTIEFCAEKLRTVIWDALPGRN